MHKSEFVLVNEIRKIFWDFEIKNRSRLEYQTETRKKKKKKNEESWEFSETCCR